MYQKKEIICNKQLYNTIQYFKIINFFIFSRKTIIIDKCNPLLNYGRTKNNYIIT